MRNTMLTSFGHNFCRAMILVAIAIVDTLVTGEYPCPCENEDLCRPIATLRAKEVWGFDGSNTTYPFVDWSQLSMVLWNRHPEVMCAAHAHDARIVPAARLRWVPGWKELLLNETARDEWISLKLEDALINHFDGINFDIEEPMEIGSKLSKAYTRLVSRTADLYHERIPGSLVSVDVAWSPNNIDGRNYDYVGLAEAADLLFVMSYDLQSQVWGRCIANPNAPIEQVERGLREFLQLGIEANKLLLGVPWYGYKYECLPTLDGKDVAEDVDICAINHESFFNCSCSDAAGSQIKYKDIMRIYEEKRTTDLRWEPYLKASYFNFKEDDGKVYQMWFDTPDSLTPKYQLANELGFRGVGFWAMDMLDYESNNDTIRNQTKSMWKALKAFTQDKATCHLDPQGECRPTRTADLVKVS